MGIVSKATIYEIAKNLTYASYVTSDISGDQWGTTFAKSVKGVHLGSPLGHVDVTKGDFAWSAKTVKTISPHDAKTARIISGRNSPDFSYGISDPRKNISATGDAVIGIWNERVDISLSRYPIGYRNSILIRNMNKMEFVYFETDSKKYDPHDYVWSENKRGNFEAMTRNGDRHRFTWQPHGGQFTIIYDVPDSAVKFSVDKKEDVDLMKVLKTQINFKKNWVRIKSK